MKKILVLIIGILAGNVGMLLWIIFSNSTLELDPNKVSMFSGVLGFSGATIAIVGTYFISISQIKNEEIMRNLDLKIKGIHDLIAIFNNVRYSASQVSSGLKHAENSKIQVAQFSTYIVESIEKIRSKHMELFRYIGILVDYEIENPEMGFVIAELNKDIERLMSTVTKEDKLDFNYDFKASEEIEALCKGWISLLTMELSEMTKIKRM